MSRRGGSTWSRRAGLSAGRTTGRAEGPGPTCLQRPAELRALRAGKSPAGSSSSDRGEGVRRREDVRGTHWDTF